MDLSTMECDGSYTLSEEASQISEISPEAAIPFAYSKIEKALIEKNKSMGESNLPLITDLPKNLFKKGIIKEKEFDIYCKMKKIKDKVLHNTTKNICISKKDAINYAKNAGLLIETIKRIRQ